MVEGAAAASCSLEYCRDVGRCNQLQCTEILGLETAEMANTAPISSSSSIQQVPLLLVKGSMDLPEQGLPL